MKRHIYEGSLIAVSGSVPGDEPVTLVMAGRTADTQADTIQSGIGPDHVILWCTPAHNSLTGELLLRRLFTDGLALEWGPPLSILDRPEVEAVIKDLSCVLGEA